MKTAVVHKALTEFFAGAPLTNIQASYSTYRVPYASVFRVRETENEVLLESDAPTPLGAIWGVVGFLLALFGGMLTVFLLGTGRSSGVWASGAVLTVGLTILLVASFQRRRSTLLSCCSRTRHLKLHFADVSWQGSAATKLVLVRCMAPQLPFPKQMTIRRYVAIAAGEAEHHYVLSADGIRDWQIVQSVFEIAKMDICVLSNVLCIDDGRLC